MITRKTFSLPDEMARALEREAARQGKPESALVRDGMQQYLASLSSSKLSLWMGAGSSGRPVDQESLHSEIVEVLERKHPRAPRRRRTRPEER